jgi:glycosyltransferase involved in cell wall biosynthesis
MKGNKVKIAFFCEGFCKSSSIAQPWRHVYELAKRMKALGNSVRIFTDEQGGFPQREEIDDILIYRIRKNRLLLNSQDLLESFNKYDADLVNWHGGLLSAVHFQRFQRSLKNGVVWTVDKGKIFPEDARNLKISDIPRLYKFWTNILYSLTPAFIVRKGANLPEVRKIIALSRRLKAYFEGIGIDQEKITSIPSGVDTKVMRPLSSSDMLSQKMAFGFNRDDQIILFFGPLSSPRGADVLISAMPKIAKKIPSAKLLLLSRKTIKDSTENKLKRAAREYPAIKLVEGTIEKVSLMRYLGIADLIALPFRFWPYTECPLTVLEGMAMAKLVVTTYAGSLPEIVKDGETGILVPPGDPTSFSKVVIRLLCNEDLSREIGRNARKYVEENHDWDLITQLTLKVFQKAVE